MNYFSEQGYSHQEVHNKIKEKYGDNYKILGTKYVMLGGFLGLFKREGVQLDGYISKETYIKKNPNFEEEKEKIIQAAKGKSTLDEVLKQVTELRNTIEQKTVVGDGTEKHETLVKVEKILEKNDFSFYYINEIINKIKKSIPLADLDNFSLILKKVRDWIRETINIYPETKPLTTPRIFILVGPTGVGKTTTIAKLAAINAIQRKLSVRIITIDSYRIGAKEQIEKYGDIMGVPVVSAENFDHLKKNIALFSRDVDLILIDTIGKSPKDYKKLAEMKELLDACGTTAEVHLAISAVTKASDIFEIMQQFESFRYNSVIITKLDETCHAGNIISTIYQSGKKISYITTGQNVPNDIKYADTEIFLEHLCDFNTAR